MSGYELALKVTLLFVTGLAVHISLSPPNPPVQDQNCSVPNTLFEKFVLSITFFSKVRYLLNQMITAFKTSDSVRNMGGDDMGHPRNIDDLCLAHSSSSLGSHGSDTTYLSWN
jgi:hypothetical protein